MPTFQKPNEGELRQLKADFLRACEQGNAAALEQIFTQIPPSETEQLRAMIKADDYAAFRAAAARGDLPVVQALLEKATATGQLRAMIQADGYGAFHWAATEGHLSVVHALLEKAETGQLAAMMQARSYVRHDPTLSYLPFINAAGAGYLPVVQVLLKKATETGQLTAMLQANEYAAFRKAAYGSHLPVLQALLEKATETGQLTAMIEANGYIVFVNAAIAGRLPVVQALLEKATKTRQLRDMIRADDYKAFRKAVYGSHLPVVQALLEKATETGQLRAMIEAEHYIVFINAARSGCLPVVQALLEKVTETGQLTAMIQADHYRAFREAAARGDLPVVQALLEKATETGQLAAMIATDYYEAFHKAVDNNHTRIVHHLLSFSNMFAHAEQHIQERNYEAYVRSFMYRKLTELHRRAGQGTPARIVFTQEEAKLCFYMLRHLIRQRPISEAQLTDFLFLINIRAVQDILHRPISPDAPNELLQLAMSLGQREITNLLLEVPAVFDEAAAHQFYERQGAAVRIAAEHVQAVATQSKNPLVRFVKNLSRLDTTLKELSQTLSASENPVQMLIDWLRRHSAHPKTPMLLGWLQHNASSNAPPRFDELPAAPTGTLLSALRSRDEMPSAPTPLESHGSPVTRESTGQSGPAQGVVAESGHRHGFKASE